MDEPTRQFRINKVDHTGITVSSLDEALPFWVNVLGFKHLFTTTLENNAFSENIVGVDGAALTVAMLEGPGHRIELLEYHAPEGRQVLKPRSCDVGSVHVAFCVDDLDALLERIERFDWRRVGVPQTWESGGQVGTKVIYVRNPDGVTLEFLQPPDH